MGTDWPESCTGCRAARLNYRCESCYQIVPNPKYRSDVTCTFCGKFVVEHGTKSARHNILRYICHHCLNVVANPKFTNFHGCAGCAPPRCDDCHEVLGISPALDYAKCPSCGRIYEGL